jgi:hypothetical protein
VIPVPDPSDVPTVAVEAAGAWFDLGRTKAYEEARRYLATGGAEGLPVIAFGRTLRCPVAACRRLLGLEVGGEERADIHVAPEDAATDEGASVVPLRRGGSDAG